MRPPYKFALWLALLYLFVLGLIGLAGLALWADLNAFERDLASVLIEDRVTLLLMLAFLLVFVVGALLRSFWSAYPAAQTKLGEEVRIMHTVNPEHRVAIAGTAEMRQLGAAINAFAEAHSVLRHDVETRIDESNAHLEQEKNRLAALMSELAQSVLVCNNEGRILLYNARAPQLLNRDANALAAVGGVAGVTGVTGAVGMAGLAGAPVGLGRSIFGILDKSLIVHALDKIRRRIEQQSPSPVAHFVTARGGQLLRAQMAPVLDYRGGITGFVLILEDITRSVEVNSRRDFLLQQLTEGTRASLANIRAAAETVQQYPDMDADRRHRFTEVIQDEAQKLSTRLDESLARHADTLRAQWPLEDMLATDLIFALQRNFEAGLGVTARYEGGDEPLWLSVDSYSLVQALTHVMGRIESTFGTREVTLELAVEGRFMRLTLGWHGRPLEPGQLHEWEEQPLAVGAEGAEGGASTVKEVLERHGGDVWCQADRAAGVNRLCLQLPTAQPETITPLSEAAKSRPVYYDFDLFSQPGQTPELDERPLTELSYTVFDTETTGLSPAEGDEIISIGAVRIVNGRLLKQECFDQLVNPRRAVRKESQQIHGISPQMLAGQPTIEQVLPVFHRFAEETVLVAHNAAFDMRFLQLKETQTGIKFIQPVLDTLLLSALAHPGHPEAEHRLEEIAARLGIHVIGRHTALGDAIVTGEVFLKLIPLLAERGIHTLRQAREASQKTFYAKLEY